MSLSGRKLFNALEPMKTVWPDGWFEKLTMIQRLIVLRVLRPDKVIPGIQELIASELGEKFIEGGGALDLASVYEDSARSRNDPIIFILSPGVGSYRRNHETC